MQKYTIRISGMDFNIVSDATPEDLQTVTDLLNQKMDEICKKSPRCSKNEAAILCALSYCSEKVTMQGTFQKLERDCSLRAEEIERLKQVVEVLQSENERLRRGAVETPQKADPVPTVKENTDPKKPPQRLGVGHMFEYLTFRDE